ncbi:unnamed protein product [Parnassius apollo]|uniref:(apollo) hypothetical protein n=1 Tax=Parnassius apollo TaxID=110799 RepID=A0A8S3Y679_PARAO|nr:unnamed protein product [Parnassius apollo]
MNGTLKVLMLKHLLVRVHRFINTTVELLSPVLFFIILYIFKDKINQPKPSHAQNELNIYNTEPIPLESVRGPSLIYYTPDTDLTGLLMDRVGDKLGLERLKYFSRYPTSGYYPIANIGDLSDTIHFMDEHVAVVVFQDISGTWPKNLNYTIRIKADFMTHLYNPQDGGVGPHERFGTIYEPFMRLQWAIDTSYLQLLGVNINQTVTLQEFPYVMMNYNGNQVIVILSAVLNVMCWLSLLLVFVFLMSRLLEERISGIEELIKMSGVSGNTLGISHFLNVVPTGLMYCVVNTALLTASANPVIPSSNPLLICIILALHFVSVIAMAFACSYFVKNTQYVVTLSLFAYVALWVPWRLASEHAPRSLIALAGLLPHMPLHAFWEELAALERFGQGLAFSNMAKTHGAKSFSVLLSMLFFIVQSAIFFLLAWYLSHVNPGPYGQALPWSFIFRRQYWYQKKITPKTEFEESEEPITQDPLFFEDAPKNLEAGIKIVNVTKVFPKKLALSNVSLDIYKGEITVLLGHNGAGKTTLMNIITGMISATSGKVYVEGFDNVTQKNKVRKLIGLCPQHNLFFSNLTVLEHIIFFSMLKGMGYREARVESSELVRQLGLVGKESSRSGQLSGGMKRRLQLACALAGRARVLVLDEPTSGLDVETRRSLWDLLLVSDEPTSGLDVEMRRSLWDLLLVSDEPTSGLDVDTRRSLWDLLLVSDEPTSGLDVETRRSLWDLLLVSDEPTSGLDVETRRSLWDLLLVSDEPTSGLDVETRRSLWDLLLVSDEPTSGLDVETRRSLWDLLLVSDEPTSGLDVETRRSLWDLLLVGSTSGLDVERAARCGTCCCLDVETRRSLWDLLLVSDEPTSGLDVETRRSLWDLLLVSDEPTSGLDVETRRSLWDLLLSLRGDRCVLLSTHFMEEADALGDRVAALHNGRLRCHATTMHLKRALGTSCALLCTLYIHMYTLLASRHHHAPQARARYVPRTTLYTIYTHVHTARFTSPPCTSSAHSRDLGFGVWRDDSAATPPCTSSARSVRPAHYSVYSIYTCTRCTLHVTTMHLKRALGTSRALLCTLYIHMYTLHASRHHHAPQARARYVPRTILYTLYTHVHAARFTSPPCTSSARSVRPAHCSVHSIYTCTRCTLHVTTMHLKRALGTSRALFCTLYIHMYTLHASRYHHAPQARAGYVPRTILYTLYTHVHAAHFTSPQCTSSARSVRPAHYSVHSIYTCTRCTLHVTTMYLKRALGTSRALFCTLYIHMYTLHASRHHNAPQARARYVPRTTLYTLYTHVHAARFTSPPCTSSARSVRPAHCSVHSIYTCTRCTLHVTTMHLKRALGTSRALLCTLYIHMYTLHASRHHHAPQERARYVPRTILYTLYTHVHAARFTSPQCTSSARSVRPAHYSVHSIYTCTRCTLHVTTMHLKRALGTSRALFCTLYIHMYTLHASRHHNAPQARARYVPRTTLYTLYTHVHAARFTSPPCTSSASSVRPAHYSVHSIYTCTRCTLHVTTMHLKRALGTSRALFCTLYIHMYTLHASRHHHAPQARARYVPRTTLYTLYTHVHAARFTSPPCTSSARSVRPAHYSVHSIYTCTRCTLHVTTMHLKRALGTSRALLCTLYIHMYTLHASRHHRAPQARARYVPRTILYTLYTHVHAARFMSPQCTSSARSVRPAHYSVHSIYTCTRCTLHVTTMHLKRALGTSRALLCTLYIHMYTLHTSRHHHAPQARARYVPRTALYTLYTHVHAARFTSPPCTSSARSVRPAHYSVHSIYTCTRCTLHVTTMHFKRALGTSRALLCTLYIHMYTLHASRHHHAPQARARYVPRTTLYTLYTHVHAARFTSPPCTSSARSVRPAHYSVHSIYTCTRCTLHVTTMHFKRALGTSRALLCTLYIHMYTLHATTMHLKRALGTFRALLCTLYIHMYTLHASRHHNAPQARARYVPRTTLYTLYTHVHAARFTSPPCTSSARSVRPAHCSVHCIYTCTRCTLHVTTMHLKRAYGTGYRLSFTTIGIPKEQAITNVVKSHVADASVKEKSLNTITYNLPAKNSTKFPQLFKTLESKRSELAIDTIGVGISTLEEVFLKLCSDIDTTFTQDGVDGGSVEPTYKTVTGIRLYWRQLLVLLRRQVKYLLSKKMSVLILLVIMPILTLAVFTYISNDSSNDVKRNPVALMDLSLYEDLPERRVLYNINTSDIALRTLTDHYNDVVFEKTDDVVASLLAYGKKDIVEYNKYLVGIELNDTDAKVLFTTRVRHAAPAALSLLAALLGALSAAPLGAPRAAHSLATYNQPLADPKLDSSSANSMVQPKNVVMSAMWASVVVFVVLATNINLVSLPCKERRSGARRLHLLAGCDGSLHWAATLLAHTALCVLTLLLPALLLAASLDAEATLSQPDLLGTMFVVLLLGSLSFFSFMYLVSFYFGERGSSTVLVACIIIFGFFTTSMKTADDIFKGNQDKDFWHYILTFCSFIAPPHTLTIAAMKAVNVARLNAYCTLNKPKCPRLFVPEDGFDTNTCCVLNSNPRCYFCIDDYSPAQSMLIMFCQFIVYMTLVILTQHGVFNRLADRLFNQRYSPKYKDDADEMVRAEKTYVSQAIALPPNQIQEAMLVDDIHKNYVQLFKKSCNAVKGVSFSVKKGECFGLLGVNGAGKSSTFKMLTAEECPTRGTIFANGQHLKKNRGKYLHSLGYCPQFFGLDDFLSGYDNLALLLTLRGLSAKDVKSAAMSWIEVVGLQQSAGRRAAGYSGGMARRLAAGAALCTGARVALLDEPTSGVDVSARRRVWAALRRALAARRATVVTSHSMDEMEALCSRIAIMSGGRVRALGSAAALRAAHASGHAVQLKLRPGPAHSYKDVTDSSKSDVERLKSELHQKFNCQLKDEHKTMLHYHINETMRYSDLFTELEALKNLNPIVEDYSVTETTLEEVFLSFAKENHNDTGDIAVTAV